MSHGSRTPLTALLLVCGLAITPELNNALNEGLLAADVELPAAAHFRIVATRSELLIGGHTVSQQHEEELERIANVAFPDTTIKTEFDPLGLVPDYWQRVTSSVLRALADTSSAHAELRQQHLRIRAVVVDEMAWRSQLGALLAKMPDTVAVSQHTILMQNDKAPARICRSALDSFAVGDINFEGSSVRLKNSAIPRLARVTAIATICRNAFLRITGHTDASGPAAWNQRLSLDRANAVADYLVQQGIDRTRMLAVGAGSTVAIADNETYYGRGLNRRIDIEFTAPAE